MLRVRNAVHLNCRRRILDRVQVGVGERTTLRAGDDIFDGWQRIAPGWLGVTGRTNQCLRYPERTIFGNLRPPRWSKSNESSEMTLVPFHVIFESVRGDHAER